MPREVLDAIAGRGPAGCRARTVLDPFLDNRGRVCQTARGSRSSPLPIRGDPSQALLRILDANLNRAREGLRVCEEVARFILEDAGLTRQTQLLRRGLARVVSRLPRQRLLQARDARADVGRPEKRGKVKSHHAWGDLVTANWMRVEEALRVLEELMRLYFPFESRACGRLRFKAYTLEQTFHSRLLALRHH